LLRRRGRALFRGARSDGSEAGDAASWYPRASRLVDARSARCYGWPRRGSAGQDWAASHFRARSGQQQRGGKRYHGYASGGYSAHHLQDADDGRTAGRARRDPRSRLRRGRVAESDHQVRFKEVKRWFVERALVVPATHSGYAVVSDPEQLAKRWTSSTTLAAGTSSARDERPHAGGVSGIADVMNEVGRACQARDLHSSITTTLGSSRISRGKRGSTS